VLINASGSGSGLPKKGLARLTMVLSRRRISRRKKIQILEYIMESKTEQLGLDACDGGATEKES